MKGIILITGGSRGLGSRFVERLAAEKDRMIYFTYNTSVDKAAALEERFGNVTGVKCDQSNDKDILDCVSKIESEQGGVDILVNNACPSFKPVDFLNTDWKMFQDIIDVDVKGSYLFSRECGKIMKKQGSGKIINILSSTIVNLPPKKLSFYVTAKHALLGLSKVTAVELCKCGITVNMISPGLMDTDLSAYLPKKYIEMFIDKHPMKRITTTDDVADALEFLISDKAQFINGVNIPVNGGESFLC